MDYINTLKSVVNTNSRKTVLLEFDSLIESASDEELLYMMFSLCSMISMEGE